MTDDMRPAALRAGATRPTIKDVAALAEVSYQTVSRCINRPDSVRPGTRDRVESAVRALDWVPNEAARQLQGLAGSRARDRS